MECITKYKNKKSLQEICRFKQLHKLKCALVQNSANLRYPPLSGKNCFQHNIDSRMNCLSDTHLKSIAEFVTHDAVQQRIDARGQKVQDARHVRERQVDVAKQMVGGLRRLAVHGHHTLRMKRRPAEEERHRNRNCIQEPFDTEHANC